MRLVPVRTNLVTYLAVCLVAPAPSIDGCSNSMLYYSKSVGTILYRENVRVLYSTELPALSIAIA
jgi:hypothetical protein